MLPPNDELTICFAHVAYRLHERFSALATGINSFEVRDPETLERRVGEAEVLVVSGLWQDGLLDRAKKLRFVQAIGAGTDQFPREELAKRRIQLASARGVNYRAVAEHAMALILALSRRLPEARDNQAQRVWRGMIGDLSRREDELGGKMLLVVGLGQIGGRLAQLAKAFDMRVVGLRRDPAAGRGAADAVHTMSELKTLLPAADFVALTCPLTKETERLIDANALGRMKPSAHLVNVARGRVVDEAALAPSSRELSRFVTSVYVAAPALGFGRTDANEFVKLFLEAYRRALGHGKAHLVERDTATGMVKTLLEQVKKRKRTQLVESRTSWKKGRKPLTQCLAWLVRRFVHEPGSPLPVEYSFRHRENVGHTKEWACRSWGPLPGECCAESRFERRLDQRTRRRS